MPKLPGVNHLDAVRALERAGFRIIRQGKHIVMSDGARLLTIPRHNPIKAFTIGGIVNDAGLSGRKISGFPLREGLTWPSGPRPAKGGRITISGQLGDDAKPYQVREVRTKIRESKP